MRASHQKIWNVHSSARLIWPGSEHEITKVNPSVGRTFPSSATTHSVWKDSAFRAPATSQNCSHQILHPLPSSTLIFSTVPFSSLIYSILLYASLFFSSVLFILLLSILLFFSLLFSTRLFYTLPYSSLCHYTLLFCTVHSALLYSTRFFLSTLFYSTLVFLFFSSLLYSSLLFSLTFTLHVQISVIQKFFHKTSFDCDLVLFLHVPHVRTFDDIVIMILISYCIFLFFWLLQVEDTKDLCKSPLLHVIVLASVKLLSLCFIMFVSKLQNQMRSPWIRRRM